MNITMVCSNTYVMPTCVAITSIIENCCREMDIYVLCDNLSSEQIDLLKSLSTEKVHVIIIEVDSENLKEYEIKGFHVTVTALFKFFIPEILPDLEKTVYLDCDVIVKNDISDMYDLDLTGKYAGVVAGGTDGDCINKFASKSKVLQSKGIHYFSTGVMVLNLKKMREDNIPDKLFEYRMEKNNTFMDQDTFNVIFGDCVTYLSFEYNCMTWLLENRSLDKIIDFYDIQYTCADELFDNVKIIHYCGHQKPWKYYDMPFSELWFSFYKKSPLSLISLSRQSSAYEYEMRYHAIISSKSYIFSQMLSKIVRKIRFWKLRK